MHFVKAQLSKGTRVALQTECNILFSDLSADNGGNDEGFHPCELLLASINAALMHSIKTSLCVFKDVIEEIIVVSFWEENYTLPITCRISVQGDSIRYDPKKLKQELYHTPFCKIFPKKTIKIEFINHKDQK